MIVIGAGVSGLACARELSHRKHQVLVVEARNRSGGRLKGQAMYNASRTTTPIDVGGALVHGITNNPIFQICDQMGITTVPVSETVLLQADGTPVDQQADEQVSELFNQCLEETFQKIQQIRDNNNNYTRTSQQSFGELFDTTVPPDQKNLLFSWHQANLELSCGASFSHLGHDWNDDEPYEYMGAHVALQQSWNAVTETLAEDLDILYNAPIQSIRVVYPQQQQEETKKRSTQQEHTTTTSSPLPTRKSRRLQGEEANVRRSARSTKGVASPLLSISDSTSLSYDANVRYPSPNKRKTTPASPKVQVTLQNGKVLQADAVVCTLPLGILKLAPDEPGHVSFDPPLSPEKQHAIQTLGCGLLNKCVISFPHVFWQDSDFLGVVDDPPHLILNASIVTGQPILVFMFGGNYAFQVEDLTRCGNYEPVHECTAQVVQDSCTRTIGLCCYKMGT